MPKPVTIFCSYAHRDEALRDELGQHLRLLVRQEKIVIWHDRWIQAGEKWEKAISDQLEQADIVLLLITKNFIDSEFCYDIEMSRALERAAAGKALVIPIMLEPVYWKGAEFGVFQVLPKDALPVTKWPDRNDAFLNVVEGIAGAVEQFHGVGDDNPSLAKVQPIPDPPQREEIEEHHPAYTPNPFGDRGRITDPARFFDREELLRQIFEELGKGVNLSLVGESQIGKSSILRRICELGPEYFASRGHPSPTFVYLSLQVVDHEDDFYDALCDGLGVATCRGYKLTRALRGRSYVLCLDEIEKMAWDGFTRNLRSQLRGLADGGDAPLRLVIASRSPLGHLFPDSPELDSPLAGMFCRQLDVMPFSEEVMRDFLAHRLQRTGIVFAEQDIARLWIETQGHPAKVQDRAARLYNRLINA